MQLVPNWRAVLIKAWSVQLIGFATFLQIAAQIVPQLGDILPWWVTVLILLAASVARLVKQPSVSGDDA